MPQTRPTLLIVDDEPAILKALELVLSASFFVVPAESAGEALGMVALGLNPDVILTDLNLGAMDGLGLRADLPMHLRDRVVLMTGGVVRAAAAEAIRVHNVPLVHKPADVPLLEAVLLLAAHKVDRLAA